MEEGAEGRFHSHMCRKNRKRWIGMTMERDTLLFIHSYKIQNLIVMGMYAHERRGHVLNEK